MSALEREGGVLWTYRVESDLAVEEARDRAYFTLRDDLARALGLHDGSSTPPPEALGRLRAQLRLDRPAGSHDGITLTIVGDTDPARLQSTFGDLRSTPRAAGRGFDLRLPSDQVASLRDAAPRQIVETLRRRLRALAIRGTVGLAGDRVEVVLPLLPAGALADLRELLGQTGRLEMKMVDDAADVLDAASRDPGEIPRGLSFALENAPIGEGRTQVVHYARMMKADGEPLSGARRRLLAWSEKAAPLDGDHEIGVGRLMEYDEERDKAEVIGFRTYHLLGKPEITGDMVRDARAMNVERWVVRLELTPAGAARFEDLTGRNTRRRFAIILDGAVESAPVILARIPGGVASITMGSESPEQQRTDAILLQGVLSSGALAAPLAPLDERTVTPSKGALALDRGLIGAMGLSAAALVIAIIRATRTRKRKREA